MTPANVAGLTISANQIGPIWTPLKTSLATLESTSEIELKPTQPLAA